MATPKEVKEAVSAYVDHKSPQAFEMLKTLVSETTFTRNDPQTYGEDSDWDPNSWEVAVRQYGMTGKEISELFQVAKFKQ